MDFSERYRVIESRDRRFDGQFVTAVRTTGIYCRPSCPARTPRPGNVEFFATSAAAHLAGYRACKRCLPEAVPGSPQWSLRDDTAARAMRLIGDGIIEREGVGGLARRLGYSERQLGRILMEQLGAGALALARAQRAQNARTLITATTMPMSELAFAAGFTSIRQFNETIAEVFGLTPSALRARHRRAAGGERSRESPGTIRIALPVRAPFDLDGLFRWFAARAIPGVEELAGDWYARTLRMPGGAASVALRRNKDHVEAAVTLEALSELPAVISRIRRLLDLDADPVAIDAVLAADARLAPGVRHSPGIRVPGAVDADELLVRTIMGQQISVAAARTQLSRLVAELGEPVPEGLQRTRAEERPGGAARAARTSGAVRTGAGPTARRTAAAAPQDIPTPQLLFPSPAELAEHGARLVTGPAARAATLVRVAGSLVDGTLAPDLAQTREELVASLTAIRGIGPWTADSVAMRFLGHPDVLIRGDGAIRAGARRLGLADGEGMLHSAAARFAPWRSYLGMHLHAASAPRATTPSRTTKDTP